MISGELDADLSRRPFKLERWSSEVLQARQVDNILPARVISLGCHLPEGLFTPGAARG